MSGNGHGDIRPSSRCGRRPPIVGHVAYVRLACELQTYGNTGEGKIGIYKYSRGRVLCHPQSLSNITAEISWPCLTGFRNVCRKSRRPSPFRGLFSLKGSKLQTSNKLHRDLDSRVLTLKPTTIPFPVCPLSTLPRNLEITSDPTSSPSGTSRTLITADASTHKLLRVEQERLPTLEATGYVAGHFSQQHPKADMEGPFASFNAHLGCDSPHTSHLVPDSARQRALCSRRPGA